MTRVSHPPHGGQAARPSRRRAVSSLFQDVTVKPPRAPSPAQAKLLAEIALLREHARAVEVQAARIAHVRPGTPETALARYLSSVLSTAERMLEAATTEGRALELELPAPAELGNETARLRLLPAPAQVIQIAPYLARKGGARG